jgi:hypothetical protein
MKLIPKTVVATVITTLFATFCLASPAAAGTTLQRGVTDWYVPRLQTLLELNVHGDFFAYDEYTEHFGPVTTKSLKHWQRAAGLEVTDTIAVGSRQWKQLKAEALVVPASVRKKSVRHAREQHWSVDIDKTRHKLTVLHYNRRLGRVVVARQADVRFGDLRGPQYFSCVGDYAIAEKGGVNYRSHSYADGEGNGILMPYSRFLQACSNGGEAIHYSADFYAYGYSRASHGCFNLRDLHVARFVYNHVHPGKRVVVHGQVS